MHIGSQGNSALQLTKNISQVWCCLILQLLEKGVGMKTKNISVPFS